MGKRTLHVEGWAGVKRKIAVSLGLGVLAAGQMYGQSPVAPAQPAATPAPPLRLNSLAADTQHDPFPPVNPKFFTADTPTAATVDSYLHAMLGFDANRIWRVVAIQKTASAGVSKVTALVSERAPNAKVLTAIFYVLPDGKHLIAPDASGLSNFGADPFAENRALLQARANGPAHGAVSKELELVEFADLQCPRCKDAQATINRLAQDFPKARVVYESFPLTEIHPYAFQAAAYGACIAKTNQTAFFTYAQAVYDTQGALLPDTWEATLNNAVTKAGMDPAAISTCAASAAAKEDVSASTRLANDLGVEQTPTLAINGRLISPNAVPYETLRSLIAFQAAADGVQGVSGPVLDAPAALKPR